MQFSLNKKIVGTVSVVVAMLVLLGGVSCWATIISLAGAVNEATTRLKDAKEVNLAAFWAVKQYQNRADLIINMNLQSVDDFKDF